MRARMGWVILAAVTALVAPAGAAGAPPRLSVASVGAPPATAAAGTALTVTGRVVNRGPQAIRVATTFTLRRTRSTGIHRLASGRALVVRARGSRVVKVAVRLPALRVGARYGLFACTRRVGALRPTCRAARRRLLVVAAPRPAAPALSGAPGAPPASAPAPAAGGRAFTPGARSSGDVLFPTIGNGGYDAQKYDLVLSYLPTTRQLDGVATMTATATQDLSELSVDLQGLTVAAVTVDGVTAAFTRAATKLVVTPRAGIPRGATFTVKTTYGGQESAITDPDGSSEGWVPTADGADAVGEPIGSQGWFPSNNQPGDKALYDFHTTVPLGLKAINNGRLLSRVSGATSETWNWSEDSPMSSYLATTVIGAFTLTEDTTTTPGRPYYTSVDTAFSTAGTLTAQQDEARVPSILAFYEGLYGPYPFTSAGGTFDDAPGLGYSLETQTKPLYPLSNTGIDTIAHENGHMWFGDSVTLRVWKDIWLNEGMTNFSSWFWSWRKDGGTPTPTVFQRYYDDATPGSFWAVPPADPPTAADIFDTDAMYNRGAMVCEAMRQILGEGTFFAIQRAWHARHRHGNATTAQWIALVKELGGKDPARLDEFFRQWLFTSYPTKDGATKPPMAIANFATYPLG